VAQHIFSTPGGEAERNSQSSKQPGKGPNEFERQTLVGLFAANKLLEAEALAQMLIERFPKHSLAWKVLGAVYKQLGRHDEAFGPMQKAIKLAPLDYQAHNNLGVLLKDVGRLDDAIASYRRAVGINQHFADALRNLGSALHEKGELSEALACYKKKVALTPDDLDAQYHVAALSGSQVERPPESYVRGVFDHYAKTFDSHLVQHLGYEMPIQLADLIRSQRPAPQRDLQVLDLGCGTGLVGQEIKDVCARLVGVDLSPKMLEVAAAKSIYDELHCAELTAMMQSQASQSYDVIVAADVFIYIGNLSEVVKEVKRLLRPGGLFYFTAEALDQSVMNAGPHPDEAPFFLQTSGRYAHAPTYLDALRSEHQFDAGSFKSVHLRMDRHQPISGYLVSWLIP
jgi:predicted TPR repeat methyltransferase